MEVTLTVIALALAVISYGAYLINVFRGKTKPHAVTWLVWAILHSFIFTQQLAGGAGPVAMVTGFAGLANFVIFVAALRYGERTITRFDWLCLGLAGIMLALWLVSADVTLAVYLAVGIFLLGFLPTLRKSVRKAHEETATTYALSGLKFLLALAALEVYTVVTALYPLTLFLVNSIFAVYLVSARRRTRKPRRKGRAS